MVGLEEVRERIQMNKSVETKTRLPISIVIPAYAEEKLLPLLLKSINEQKFLPEEVIVADANSPDNTAKIAVEMGAKVVEGGKIARGRNAGAAVAKSKYLLFLDADSQLPTDTTLVEAFLEYLKTETDIASARYIIPKNQENSKFARVMGYLIFTFANVVRHLQNFSQKLNWEGGAFILIKRSVFEHVGGFNESLTIGEDRDFYQRAFKLGYKYRNLDVSISTSLRRFDTPSKAIRVSSFVIFEAIVLGTGIYAGVSLVKKFWKMYGRLGGGDGKDPQE